MPGVIVSASERSIIHAMAPSPEEVLAAFKKYTGYGDAQWGKFVGPRPRITRQTVLGAGIDTKASWLYAWPVSPWVEQHLPYLKRRLRDDVYQALRENSADWSQVSIADWNPSVHGSAQWWQTGQASNTATERSASATTPSENPIGPTRDSSLTGGLREGLSSGTEKVILYGAGALALYGLFLLWKK